MPVNYFLEILMGGDLLLSQQLFGSFALIAPFSSFMLLITLWDFWRDPSFVRAKGFRTKLSALKKWLDFVAISKQEQTIELILELPKSDQLPSFVDMAKLLVKALPASDRSEAYTLLVTQLLPKKWARRATFLAPRAQCETIFHRLANALQQAPPNQRLDLLRADLCEIEIKQLSLDSLMLAVARYVKEHPDATNLAQNWLGSRDPSKWLAMSASELEEEALQIWEQVDKWDELAKAKHPEVWEEYKLKPFNAQLNLESALSGSFHVAMGEFAIFLDVVGASFKKIRLF